VSTRARCHELLDALLDKSLEACRLWHATWHPVGTPPAPDADQRAASNARVEVLMKARPALRDAIDATVVAESGLDAGQIRRHLS
jgi:hypothetical protein